MVYIMLGKGFEETEAVAPGDVLRRAQIPMQYVGIGGKIVEGAHGIAIQADITLEEMDLTAMDMIVRMRTQILLHDTETSCDRN